MAGKDRCKDGMDGGMDVSKEGRGQGQRSTLAGDVSVLQEAGKRMARKDRCKDGMDGGRYVSKEVMQLKRGSRSKVNANGG